MALATSLRKLGRTGRVEDLKIGHRMTAVFQELVVRHRTLVKAKRWEFGWKALFMLGCAVGLILLGVGIQTGRFGPFWTYPGLLLSNLFFFTKARTAVELSQKAMINFGVVRHHLMGMLEVVGVCECSGGCDCRETFRRQALVEYGISLY